MLGSCTIPDHPLYCPRPSSCTEPTKRYRKTGSEVNTRTLDSRRISQKRLCARTFVEFGYLALKLSSVRLFKGPVLWRYLNIGSHGLDRKGCLAERGMADALQLEAWRLEPEAVIRYLTPISSGLRLPGHEASYILDQQTRVPEPCSNCSCCSKL